ncbi:MAG TPA: TerB family tellurite resistance protein [Candidatus Limnocylindrales bacterium]|nr:TerB family tellurite resistance protein [Candidatus Limnocylindrales bacterium]
MSYLRFLHPGRDVAPVRPAGPSTSPDAETATVRRIVGQLEALPPDRAAFIAGFAYILARVANADLDISDAEAAEIEQLVMAQGGMSEAEAVLVVGIARTQARLEGATEDYLVTRRFREISTVEQRQQLLACLFAVAIAGDETISAEENVEIRQISDELGFTMAELNAVRSTYAGWMSSVATVALAARRAAKSDPTPATPSAAVPTAEVPSSGPASPEAAPAGTPAAEPTPPGSSPTAESEGGR